MKPDRDTDRHNDEVAEMFSDLPPFTITINDGHDAAWLSSAALSWMAGSNYKLGEKALKAICLASLKLGVEKGVNEFFDVGLEDGHRFPKFMKPLFIHMVGHALKKFKEKNEK